ncbi:MAG: N-acetylmuramoyl-L-alanine amidase [Deinococcota bacterium]
MPKHVSQQQLSQVSPQLLLLEQPNTDADRTTSRRARRRSLATGLLIALTCWWVVAARFPADSGARAATLSESSVGSSRRWGWASSPRLWPARRIPKVALQIGHEAVQNHPEELRNLRWNTGGYANGIQELDINRAVVARLQTRLQEAGVEVDVLPATPPQGYRADLFISVHADSVTDPRRSGYKSAYFEPLRNSYDANLKMHIDNAYLAASRLPDDSLNISPTMREFYAFNHEAYNHSLDPSTPGLIVEMGYISNSQDLAYLSKASEPADALYQGILSYLKAHNKLPSRSQPRASLIRIPELHAEVMRVRAPATR